MNAQMTAAKTNVETKKREAPLQMPLAFICSRTQAKLFN